MDMFDLNVEAVNTHRNRPIVRTDFLTLFHAKTVCSFENVNDNLFCGDSSTLNETITR